MTGDFPGIYGWDLSYLELGDQLNIDSVPFNNIKHYIQERYKQGAIIAISWHATNPLTGVSSWDPTPGTVASILPGGVKKVAAGKGKIPAFGETGCNQIPDAQW